MFIQILSIVHSPIITSHDVVTITSFFGKITMKLFLIVLLTMGAFGAQSRGMNWKIIGGSTAGDGAYPYQISLRYYGAHFCGASIIDNITIVTSAQCVYHLTPDGMTIVAGSNQLTSGGAEQEILEIRPHLDFSTSTLDNDIAILKLAVALTLTEKVQPIELETKYTGDDVDSVVTGWGELSFPGILQNNLQQLHLKTIGTEECREALNDNRVTDNQICTYTRVGEGICFADYGGPLVSNNKQIGIVSWGRPCALGYPDVFTRVSAYIGWIEENRN